MKINMNENIKVKLTDYGRQIYKSHRAKYSEKPIEIDEDDDGFFVIQIWEFMNIFGPKTCMGMMPMIEKNNIIYDIPSSPIPSTSGRGDAKKA